MNQIVFLHVTCCIEWSKLYDWVSSGCCKVNEIDATCQMMNSIVAQIHIVLGEIPGYSVVNLHVCLGENSMCHFQWWK